MKNTEVKMEGMPLKPSKHVDRAAASLEKPSMQRLNVEIPEDLHAELKSITSRHKKKIKEVIAQLISDYVHLNK